MIVSFGVINNINCPSFTNGDLEFLLLWQHHSHDAKVCCACGDTWPCLPVDFVAEQVQAWLNERLRGPRHFRANGPEMHDLNAMITSMIGERYDLYLAGVGWLH